MPKKTTRTTKSVPTAARPSKDPKPTKAERRKRAKSVLSDLREQMQAREQAARRCRLNSPKPVKPIPLVYEIKPMLGGELLQHVAAGRVGVLTDALLDELLSVL